VVRQEAEAGPVHDRQAAGLDLEDLAAADAARVEREGELPLVAMLDEVVNLEREGHEWYVSCCGVTPSVESCRGNLS
jgi:hypothetical protein